MNEITSRRQKGTLLAFAVVCVEALFLALWAYAPLATEKAVPAYGLPLACMFIGLTAITLRGRLPLPYIVGYLFTGWYVISRILLGDVYLSTSRLYLTRTLVSYCVALPCALVLGDKRLRAVDCVAVIYAAAFTALAAVGVLCVMLDLHIWLPVFSTEIWSDSGRLTAGQHPNGCAMLFLMAMLFTLYLMVRFCRKWLWVIGGLMLLVQYMGIAFTVCRTVMLEAAIAAAVIAFSAVMRVKRISGIKRIIAALLVAVILLAVVYAGFGVCIKVKNNMAASAEAVETAAPETTQVAQRSLLADLTTLTGRTGIYKTVFTYIGKHPNVLLTGMIESDIVANIQREVSPNFWLAHNAWLQTLLTVGIPGLLAALYFTWLTAKTAVQTLLLREASTSFAQKLLILLPALLVVNCFTECVLFVEQFSVGQFAFLLCLGCAAEEGRE